MSAAVDLPEFRRKAVEPVECIKAGWNLIRNQYWLFVGLTVVGILIGDEHQRACGIDREIARPRDVARGVRASRRPADRPEARARVVAVQPLLPSQSGACLFHED